VPGDDASSAVTVRSGSSARSIASRCWLFVQLGYWAISAGAALLRVSSLRRRYDSL
jgi:hypothetical protein